MTYLLNEHSSMSLTFMSECVYRDICQEYIYTDHQYIKNNDVSILVESTNTILSKIGNWFKTMITNLMNVLDKIKMKLSANIQDLGIFCKQYADKIKDIDVNFTISGFNYTIIERIDQKYLQFTIDSYNKDIDKFRNLRKMDKMKVDYKWRNSNENFLNDIRGNLLGLSEPVTADNFVDTTRSTFRGGKLKPIPIKVDNRMVSMIISESKTLSKKEAQAKKDKEYIIDFMKKTEMFFNKTVPVIYNKKGKEEIVLHRNDINTSYKAHHDKHKSIPERMSSTNAVRSISKKISDKALDIKYDRRNERTGVDKHAVTYSYDKETYEIINKYVRDTFEFTKKISQIYSTVCIEQVNAYKEQSAFYLSIMKRISTGKSKDSDSNDK